MGHKRLARCLLLPKWILISGADPDDYVENLRRVFRRLEEKNCRCERPVRLSLCQVLRASTTERSSEKAQKQTQSWRYPHLPTSRLWRHLCAPSSFMANSCLTSRQLRSLSTVPHRLMCHGNGTATGIPASQRIDLPGKRVGPFGPALYVGLACDASSVGVGAVLFHSYPNGSERPIRNESKTLTATQRNYSQKKKRKRQWLLYLVWRSSTSTCRDVTLSSWHTTSHW